MPLPVSIRDSGDITIIDIQGRATISDAESELLRKKLTELIANGKRKCEFNLAGLSHLDKFRLSVIVKMCLSLRINGVDLRFI